MILLEDLMHSDVSQAVGVLNAPVRDLRERSCAIDNDFGLDVLQSEAYVHRVTISKEESSM